MFFLLITNLRKKKYSRRRNYKVAQKKFWKNCINPDVIKEIKLFATEFISTH